jgi:lipopolysaccharide export system protein LptA
VAPGRLEFLASRPEHHHRILDAENISIEYGEANRIRSFRAVNAKTETHPSAEESASKRGIMKTQSRNLLAHFDPNTGDMNRLEQWDNFSYEQGDRRARADRAAMDTPSDLITLDSSARVWDASGSTSANRIRMDQRKGEFTAEGNVNSTRLPDRKGQGSGMLSGDEPLQALSQHMTSQNRNSAIRYEGNVMLWQGANRLQADRVDIDREKRRLSASGHVVSQLHEERDERKAQEGGFTVVRADQLVYTDEKRLAHYKGGVLLTRNNLRVKSAELQAYLAETGSDSRLEKALADGKVEIVQTQPDRTRTGAGQHGEYYVSEERIVLTGGEPQLTDTLRGTTRGEQLIYFAGDDRLLVNGAPGRPATSRIRRK